jgi:hypothetical protein
LVTVEIGNSVTTIKNFAFYNCTSLTSIFIPSSVRTIGHSAFYGIQFMDESGNVLPNTPEGLRGYAYEGHDGVLKRVANTFVSGGLVFKYDSLSDADVTLVGFSETLSHLSVPASVSYEGKDYAVSAIGPKAFYGRSGLESVDLGSVSDIGMKAFARCTSLKSVDFGDSLAKIAPYAFFGCDSLSSVYLGSSVVSIGNSAFSGCKSLTSVEIPASVSAIGKNAFFGIQFLDERGNVLDCSADSLRGHAYVGRCCVLQCLEDSFIVITGGLVFMGDWSGDTDVTLIGYSEPITHLTVPASVTYGGKEYPVSDIGPKAFYGLSELVSADLGSVSEIGMKAFARCESLTDISFGNSLRAIGAYAFYGCDSLASAVIPGSVVSIGKCAFPFCASLSEVVIPDSVEAVGDRAFYGCDSISSIAIGSSVASIGPGSFHGLAFFDENGNELPMTAEALAGHLYAGDGDGRLFRSAA